MMKSPSFAVQWALLLVVSVFAVACLTPFASADEKPLKALLVAGGCCHDYEGQHKALFEGIQARANVQVDVWWTDDKSVDPPLNLYDDPNWADGYDIIIHDECAAGNKDLKVMKHILDVHKTIPAVHLHCAMHSFRNGTDQWFKHLGLQSSRHGPRKPIDIEFVDKEHPITKTLENWTTIDEELYNNVDVFDAIPLAVGKQIVPVDGKDVEEVAIVVWTNESQGAKSFSTTIGHTTETVEDARYLDLVTRGLLWAAGKLNDDYLGKPFKGENKITFVKGKPKPEKKPAPKKQAAVPAPAPKDATLAVVTASSEETNKGNFIWQAIDGSKDTRWCAANSSKPQWIQLEFEKPKSLTGAQIVWEGGGVYQYQIEGSKDGKEWSILTDATDNKAGGTTEASFTADGIRFVKVTCTGTSGGWASIREILLGGVSSLHPKLDEKQKAVAEKAEKEASDPYKSEGNIKPEIVKLSPEAEAEILKDVTVADGFDVSLFANWQTANYPVYVAAAPNGDLYVSSDGNGSVGRDPHRGRVLRLRDTDDDGRADEVKEFIKDIDAPRGLIWDKDRLILLHPPDISVHIDHDLDGIADESKTIVEGIAFGFDQRPPDHTTNGLEMGIDGWVYIAGGDFGFMNAKGSDGRTLQHRGGGVIRFRPDGSGLELFATGTRNILGTPMSPLLDIFARDNTNDGGGWDVRFHHFSGLEDHGYPRLYKNFAEEHIQPLADYGGGSGCGSVYISEPGFPEEWNNAPFTCDWGTAALWKHTVERKGSTFVEITDPQPLIKMTRPTDADIDGMSRVYQASWKGPATFRWAGPETGYIVRVSPKGYTPEPLPDFDKMSDSELVALLDTESHIRRLAAQRELLRRDASSETTEALSKVAQDSEKQLATRVAALYAIGQRGTSSDQSEGVIEELRQLASDSALAPFAMRALGDMAIDTVTAGNSGPAPSDLIIGGIQSDDPRTKLEAIVSAARQKLGDAAPAISDQLGSDDSVLAHTAYRALASLGAADTCFSVIESDKSNESAKRHAAYALMRMHEKSVVDQVIAKLGDETRPNVRQHLLSVLSQLYYVEANWEGDSWGTRPDTRGPYYQLDTWSESDRILAALKERLANADSEEAAFLVKEMNRNRIQSNDALKKVITMAKEDDTLVPDAVSQIAAAEEVPADGIPILLKAAANPESSPGTLAESVEGLMKTDQPDAVPISLAALAALDKTKGSNKDVERGRNGFLKAPKLENHHLAVEEYAAAHPDTREGLWANAALIELASRKTGSPESIDMSGKAIDEGWKNPEQKKALMKAAAEMRVHFLDDRIKVAVNDPDKGVAGVAKSAANRLKIDISNTDNTPKIATLSPEQALKQIIETKGDVALGEAVFARATCVACHTVNQDEPQKGPYLGNIAQTYQRPQLVESVLDPGKTIAQGFTTNVISLKDGTTLMGFVTDETGDSVTLRDIASQAHSFKKSEIEKRDTLPTSMMPPGLLMNFSVKEAASLFDYIQALAKQ